MALLASMAGCTLDGAEKTAKVRGKDIARKEAARIAKYPACTKRRKPRMITFNQTIDPVRMITVAGVGDVLLHDSVQRFAAFRPGGFANLFNPVADLIRAADVSFANLEGPAAEGISKTGRKVKTGNRRYDGRVYSGYPMFNYHPSVVGDLKAAGFDVLLTANNHTLDRYAAGADKTIEAITKAGIAFTGTRRKGDRSSPWHAITPVTQGRRTWNIAWLGCTYGTNGIPDRHGQVLHCYKQRNLVLKTIAALAKRRDVHAVMFVPHWGPEYRHAPDANQRLLARQVLEAGATAVIGSHPHVMQPIEKYVTRDKRETLIAYSLGNFVSNQIGLARRASAILLLGLKPSGDKLVMAAMGWVPIWMRNAGGLMQAEAIDRVGHPKWHRAHLLRHLPAGNLHPPKTPFFQHMACRMPPKTGATSERRNRKLKPVLTRAHALEPVLLRPVGNLPPSRVSAKAANRSASIGRR
jgi:poly-gamma-glutamate synthesis protein (capsule biosynthesis protein)